MSLMEDGAFTVAFNVDNKECRILYYIRILLISLLISIIITCIRIAADSFSNKIFWGEPVRPLKKMLSYLLYLVDL